jgi:hypothetical protein
VTENDPRDPAGAPRGPMSERMQALLSRAAEEQLTEQRQVSAVLSDLRGLVAGLAEQLRGTASSARLDALGGDLSSLFTELRMSTAALGDRLDALSQRVDEQAASTADIISTTGSGAEALALRVDGLSNDLGEQSASLERLREALGALSAFPDSLAALQREVSGLHDRLMPLAEVRTGLADLTARTGALEALRPEVEGLAGRFEGLATSADVVRTRDSLVAAVSERIDRLERVADRPTLTSEDLSAALAPLLSRMDDLAAAGPVLDRLDRLDDRLSGLEARIGDVTARVGEMSEATGAVPSVARDVGSIAARVQDLHRMQEHLAEVRAGVETLREDSPLPSLVLGVASLREDVEDVAARVADVTVPSAESVATAVGQQVTDRLVDELAPRVADLVLTRVAATLVDQVSGRVTSSVQTGLTEKVRAATVDSERRISAHVDEAVLALAEALLRRRRGGRTGTAALTQLVENELSSDAVTAAIPLPTDLPEETGPSSPTGSAPSTSAPAPVTGTDRVTTAEQVQSRQAPEAPEAPGAPDAPDAPEASGAEAREVSEAPGPSRAPSTEAPAPAAAEAPAGPRADPASTQPGAEARDAALGEAGAESGGGASTGPVGEAPGGASADSGAEGARGPSAEPALARQPSPAASSQLPPVSGATTAEQALAAQDADAVASGDAPFAGAPAGRAAVADVDIDVSGPGVGHDDRARDHVERSDGAASGTPGSQARNAAADRDLGEDEVASTPAGAPAPAGFTAFSMPRSRDADSAPARDEPSARADAQRAEVAPEPVASPEPPVAQPDAHDRYEDEDDDDELDGPPRRPWWRPGG